MLKEYQLLYLDNDIPINRSFYCNNGDIKSRGLEVHVLDNSQAKDCTGLTLKMIIKVPSGDLFEATVANGLVTVLNAASGIYQVLFPDNMGKGRLIAEIQLSNTVPEVIVSRKFSLVSDGSLTSDGVISELPRAGILWDVIKNEAQRQADFEEVLNNADVAVAEKFANLETEYATDLTGVKSQLAESVSQMQAQADVVIANATVDSEVILARGTDTTLKNRLDRIRDTSDTKYFGGNYTAKISAEPIVNGGYITATGLVTTSAPWSYTYIKAGKYEKIIISALALADTLIINTTDKDKKVLKNIGVWLPSGNYEIPLSDEIYYVCVSFKAVDIDKISISYYADGVVKDLQTLEVGLKTTQNLKSLNSGGLVKKALSDEELLTGFVNVAGTFTESAAYRHTYVDIIGAKTLRITANEIPLSSASAVACFTDKDYKVILPISDYTNLASDIYYGEGVIREAAKYIVVSCRDIHASKIFIEYEVDGLVETVEDMKVTNSDLIAKTERAGTADAFARTRNAKFIKGLHLDCGRKYFSVANIKILIDEAYAAGLNAFQIYFSDSKGFRFALDDMTMVSDGTTYNLATALGDYAGGDGSNKWLIQTEMDEIITYATAKNIEIIPAFDMPGHFGAGVVLGLNPTTERGRRGMVVLLKKYATYFANKGCTYFNICGDESGYSLAIYEAFMTMALNVITNLGMTPMLYNDEVCKEGFLTPYINTGAIVLGWSRNAGTANYATYGTIDKRGYRQVNASGVPYYWTLGQTVTNDALVANIENYNPFRMSDGTILHNIVGAIYHIWCDDADLHGVDDGAQVVVETARCIAAFGVGINRAVPSDNLVTMQSPNGATYRIDVGDSGVITATAL